MNNIHQEDIPHKQCSQCHYFFAATSDYFSRDAAKKDGWYTICKTCVHIRQRQWYEENRDYALQKGKRYYSSHQEQVLHRGRQWRRDHPEKNKERRRQETRKRREKKRTYDARYRIDQKERLKVRRKAYYDTHREENREKSARAYSLHREERRIYRQAYHQTQRGRLIRRSSHQKRRAAKRAAPGSYTGKELQEQYTRQKGKCYYCKAKLGNTWHADHILPLSRGGSNEISNIVATCPSCNLQKQYKLLHEWPEGNRLL